MSDVTAFPDVPWIPRDHDKNREKIPREELDRYRGMQVAYSWDGTHIVAGAPTFPELVKILVESGIDDSRVVFGYVESI